MSEKLQFTCPLCGKHRLESVETNATVSSEITNLDESGDFDYNPPIIHCNEVDHYQCVDCGYLLKNKTKSKIYENTEVVKWIKENS